MNHSEWAAPVVLVPKKDGSLLVCGVYKTTVNQSADVDQYPLPIVEDLFATLAGGRVFSKIDLSHAYQQVELDEESQKYLTINTHKGLYRYKRLPYGVSSAPAISVLWINRPFPNYLRPLFSKRVLVLIFSYANQFSFT